MNDTHIFVEDSDSEEELRAGASEYSHLNPVTVEDVLNRPTPTVVTPKILPVTMNKSARLTVLSTTKDRLEKLIRRRNMFTVVSSVFVPLVFLICLFGVYSKQHFPLPSSSSLNTELPKEEEILIEEHLWATLNYYKALLMISVMITIGFLVYMTNRYHSVEPLERRLLALAYVYDCAVEENERINSTVVLDILKL